MHGADGRVSPEQIDGAENQEAHADNEAQCDVQQSTRFGVLDHTGMLSIRRNRFHELQPPAIRPTSQECTEGTHGQEYKPKNQLAHLDPSAV
jgi:hypothetical protein